MGNGLQKNVQNSNGINFSSKVVMSNSIFIKKSIVQHPHNPGNKTAEIVPNNDDNMSSKIKTLTDFSVFDGLKKGRKLRALMDFSQFSNANQNIDLIFRLNKEIKELTEKMSISGLISSILARIYAEIVVKIEKSFRNKQSVIDLASEINQKRLISVLKLMVYVLNSARFFKEEVVFSEGKWWKIRDEQFLHSLEMKINSKCEAILENYENVSFFRGIF